MSETYLWISVAIITVVTALTRFLPFLLFGRGTNTPKFIEKLGGLLPFAIMGMLVIYCLKGISFTAGIGGFLPEIISVAVVIISYTVSRNTLVGITVGTVSYMLLVQLVF